MEYAARFAALKQRIGGNREKSGFEWSFGATREENSHITPPNRQIIRILSETEFAMKLSHAQAGRFSEEVGAALTVMEEDIGRNGVLTYAACRDAEEKLLPLREEAKKYTILFASHAHIDMNWMWGWQETVAVTLATFRTILNLMKEYPDFTFSQSQASVYRIVEEYAPEMKPEIRQRIREGRWEVTASAWVETDKNMPDTESLIRHIGETRDYLRGWGIAPDRVEVDVSPDTFGHSAFIPEINTFGNVRYYYHCRGLQDDLVLYRYRAPSGSEILMYREPYWYNSGITPEAGLGIFGLSEKCAGLKTGLIVYGVGDHGGGPTRRDAEHVIEMREWPVFPTLRFGTVHEFFHEAEKVREKLPVVDHEINAIFTGCYTTQSRIKLANRHSEKLLLEAETAAAFRRLALGTACPAERLRTAWRKVLFTHFHDILTGSCVQESREYAMGLYAEAVAHAQSITSASLTDLAEAVDTGIFVTGDEKEDIRFTQAEGAGSGYGISNYAGVPNPERGAGKTRIYTVFNMASCEKNAPVEITVWDYTGDLKRIEVIDAARRPVPHQILEANGRYWDHRYARILFEARIPAFGWAVFALREKPVEDYPTYYLQNDRIERPYAKIVLENEYLRAEFSPQDGRLSRLTDKNSGEEIISGPAGLTVSQASWQKQDAWKIGRWLDAVPVTGMTELTELPGGELRQGFTAHYRMLDSEADVTVTLDHGSRALSFAIEADWREWAKEKENRPALRFTVPCGPCGTMMNDVPAGVIRREAKPMDAPALTFAAAVSDKAAPMLICDCKYGFRLDDGVLSCTLINTAGHPDKYPERGIHKIRLFLGVAPADAKEMKALSGEVSHDLIPVPTAVHGGKLEASGEFLRFSGDGLQLSSLAAAPDGGYDLRMFETNGKQAEGCVSFPCPVKNAAMVDLNGKKTGEAGILGNEVRFRVGPYRIAQLHVIL